MWHTLLAMPYNTLSPAESAVMIGKQTEAPYVGKYDDFFETGIYLCRQCGTPLYESKAKFDAHCGWPSFEQEIPGSVKRTLDADGDRTEISCVTCGAHLGHEFIGEGFTATNARHCVNSLSMEFVPAIVEGVNNSK